MPTNRSNDQIFLCQTPQQLYAIGKELQSRFELQREASERSENLWLDSFDWRLWQRKMALQLQSRGEHWLGIVYDIASAEMLARQPLQGIPANAAELPCGKLASALEGITEPRALLLRSRNISNVTPLKRRNHEQKILARVELEVTKPHLGSSQATPHEPQGFAAILVRPLKGYEQYAAPLSDWLAQQTELQAIDASDYFQRQLGASGQIPGDFDPSMKLQLEPHDNCAHALRQALQQLLGNVRATLPGSIAATDSEFLHDLRVAVRRSRSALGGIKRVFADNAAQRFGNDLKWLADITSVPRDLDVYLLAMDDFRNDLAEPQQPHLQALEQHLTGQKQQAQTALAMALTSPRMQDFLRDFETFLADTSATTEGESARLEVAKAAGNSIWKQYKKVITTGSSLHAASPAEGYHTLRKDMKKLRYLMELFASLYPPEQWKQLLKVQKQLQNILGDFQDLQVQSEKLGEFGEQMHASADSSAATLMTLGSLAAKIQDRQQHALDHFGEIFAALADEATHDAFKALCKQPKSKASQ